LSEGKVQENQGIVTDKATAKIGMTHALRKGQGVKIRQERR